MFTIGRSLYTAASAALAVFLCAASSGAGELNIRELVEEAAKSNLYDLPKAVARDTTKDWTIMVYLNGKNDIEKDAVSAFNLMESVGSSDNVNVVAELGRRRGQKEDSRTWAGSKRYLVTKDNDFKTISSPVKQELPNADMGDYRHVEEFVTWAKREYPARRYMLIVWNHGYGWMDPKGPQFKAISSDFETGHFIRNTELGTMLRDIGGVDVFGMDACLMQMLEVDYEIYKYAPVIVASEEVSYRYGFNYSFLSTLEKNPSASPEELASYIVDSYATFYKVGMGFPVTLSAVRSSSLDGLNARLNAWVDAAMASKDEDAMRAARKGVLRFTSRQTYADLHHFVSLVSANTQSQELIQKGSALMTYIDDMMVLRNGVAKNNNPKFSNAKGISVTIPVVGQSPADPYGDAASGNKYGDLAFAKATKWPQFIRWLVSIR